jgi:hypothetical protein
MKVYLVSIAAYKPEINSIRMKHGCLIVHAVSEEEALGKGYKLISKDSPAKDSWSHSVVVSELLTNQLEDILDEVYASEEGQPDSAQAEPEGNIKEGSGDR